MNVKESPEYFVFIMISLSASLTPHPSSSFPPPDPESGLWESDIPRMWRIWRAEDAF